MKELKDRKDHLNQYNNKYKGFVMKRNTLIEFDRKPTETETTWYDFRNAWQTTAEQISLGLSVPFTKCEVTGIGLLKGDQTAVYLLLRPKWQSICYLLSNNLKIFL